jgi:hypothetical protein
MRANLIPYSYINLQNFVKKFILLKVDLALYYYSSSTLVYATFFIIIINLYYFKQSNGKLTAVLRSVLAKKLVPLQASRTCPLA